MVSSADDDALGDYTHSNLHNNRRHTEERVKVRGADVCKLELRGQRERVTVYLQQLHEQAVSDFESAAGKEGRQSLSELLGTLPRPKSEREKAYG